MSKAVLVYGSDHSPWVQTVLIALEQRAIPYHIIHVPISLAYYWKRGMVMPACRWPDGEITSDSFSILAEIDKRYPHDHAAPILSSNQADVRVDQSRLELMFVLYVLARFSWGNKWRFIRAWAKTTPSHPNKFAMFLSHMGRATMTLYFMILIQGGIWSQTRKNKSIYKGKRFHNELTYWIERLKEGPFFGGQHPSYIDFALLGQLQCISSGLTDFIIPVLRKEPSLLHWLERMHALIPSYKHLYSRRIFSSKPIPIASSMWGRVVFCLGFVLQLILAPFTLVILLYAFLVRNSNPARTMGVMQSVNSENDIK